MTASERPNIVLFMPDQLRADAVGCFGNGVVPTPNIDALASRGTRFANAFGQHPVCAPSRVSLMTGWYPHTRGHRSLGTLLQPHEPNLLRDLRRAGYHVAMPGHRGDVFAPGVTEESTDFCGFLEAPTMTFSRPRFPKGDPLFHAFYYGRRDTPVEGDVVVDFDEATVRTAERWLASNPPEPWCLWLPLVFPHCPFEVEDPWYSLIDRDDVPAPRPIVEDGKPSFQRLIRERYRTGELTDEQWREIIAVYWGMVARVDHHLGRVVEAVSDAGLSERTATFFLTDHGEYAGDLGLIEKWPSGLDDCLVRNPLIVEVPGRPGGRVSEAMVELVDLLPTIGDLAGVSFEHTHFGRSLTPLLADASMTHRAAAFSEGGFLAEDEPRFERPGSYYRAKGEIQHDHPQSVGKSMSVRTPGWTYVERLYEPPELYDRTDDPGELRNVAGDASHADVVAEHRDLLHEWLFRTSDVVPWAEDPRAPDIPHGWR
jgi:arylsulfatase A-like enzyme